MIVFITLVYVALLAVLIKLKFIKPTIGWKLSPLLFMLVCFIGLAVPMQWGAPSGPLNVYRYVIEITPNVSGEVVDVPVKPLEPVKEGDVLFQIDKRPFEAELDRLAAAVAEAEQKVLQLEAAFQTATANLDQEIAERDLADADYERAKAIRKTDAGAIAERSLEVGRHTLAAAEAAVRPVYMPQVVFRLGTGIQNHELP